MFELVKEDYQSKARVGYFKTDHGEIPTPVFMPVGTQATVKALQQRELVELDAKIILGNTYHLYLRPGNDVIKHFEGLHKFMNWDRALLTDSGGYQIFSLNELRNISDEGAEFKSHIDGSKHLFTPENVVETQRILGSDIMMVLDECAPYPADKNYVENSMRISIDWAQRAQNAFKNSQSRYGHRQFHFGIGQGGMYSELRKKYLDEMTQIDFDGYAIGGLSVGEPEEIMYQLTDLSTDYLPKDKPRYLMGVGTPQNILNGIERGIDMFDCVMPTRNARNGQLFTSRGKINLKNAQHKFSDDVIDDTIKSYASQNFSMGYLHHLIKTNEILGLQLATMHNIAFYLWLAGTAREKIMNNEFGQWKSQMIAKMS